jgi:8-oxo-dGTP diphosphatase
MSKPLLLVVAVALFDREGRVLLAQRPQGKSMAGLWEFPGGKIEVGETPEAALVREIEEELSVKINEKDLDPINFTSFTYDSFHLLMPLYGCRKWRGNLTPNEGQTLKWVEYSKLHDYPAPAADIPLFDALGAVKQS